jgi:glutamate carboxypeptidase
MVDPLNAALAWLAPRRGEMETLLAELVEINSYTENVDGVTRVGARLMAALEGLPLELTHARHGPGPRTLLVGHLDTVFRPGTFEGYRSDGVRAYGPGVLDMKGGLCVMVFALRALDVVGALSPLPLALVAVSDEEMGSIESQPLLRELCSTPGAARGLVFESGRDRDEIVTRRKGTGAATVTARGRAAHAGNAYAEGRNAIWALACFVDRAQRLTDYARDITVNVGRIEGGQGKNTVPEQAVALVDFRFVSTGDGEATLEALRRAAADAATAVPGTTLELQGGLARSALERGEASRALCDAYGACARAAGLGAGEAPLQGGASDANTLSAVGVPSICALGPRGTGYHTKGEQVELATLVPKTEALVRFLLTLPRT